MQRKTLAAAAALAALASVSTVLAVQPGGWFDEPPALPATAHASPVSLVRAHRFTLAEPGVHVWRAEQPAFDRGWVVALAADPALLFPRQSAQPVLYVGDQTAERVNAGHESGFLIAIVPGDVDLASAPIFFGAPDLPERVDAARAVAELERARAHGAAPVGPGALARVQREAIALSDHHHLLVFASRLVEELSPGERDLITGLRAPRVDR